MKFGLSEDIVKKIKQISNKYKHKFYIFGSRARGDYKKNSDIDIAINEYKNEEEKFKIMNELDMLEIPYMLDIVFINEISNKEFLKNILEQGVEV